MNEPLKISAMFTGTNSIGYEAGKTYNLFIDNKPGVLAKKSQIIIWDADDAENRKTCEYGSVKAFLLNWSMIISTERWSKILTSAHALTQTKHSRVIFALEKSLEIEKVFLTKPSKRFSLKELSAGIDEIAVTNSRRVAELSITQFEHALSIFRGNEWVVGSNDLELALREFARSNFSDMNGEKFAGDIIEILKKRVVTE
jgi:hypothetical protein